MGVVAVVIIIVAAVVVVIIIIIMQSAVASTLYDCSCILQHTHTRPFNGPLSGITRVSWYHFWYQLTRVIPDKSKHSSTHTHDDEEEGFAQTTRPALSQRGLLDPIKPPFY